MSSLMSSGVANDDRMFLRKIDGLGRGLDQSRKSVHIGKQQTFEFVPLDVGQYSILIRANLLLNFLTQ